MKTTLAHQVGHRIRVRRADFNLTQAQLAQAVGIGQAQMSHLERGNKQLNLARLEQIAKVLGCSPVDLLDERHEDLRVMPSYSITRRSIVCYGVTDKITNPRKHKTRALACRLGRGSWLTNTSNCNDRSESII